MNGTGTWRDDRVGSALRGENPTVPRRLDTGFAVIGDAQFLPGYARPLTDDPAADRLTDLPKAPRPRPRHDALRAALGEEIDRLRTPARRPQPAPTPHPAGTRSSTPPANTSYSGSDSRCT